MPTTTFNSSLDLLRRDFRRQLEEFYASLNLAPPYDSLEKAVRLLSIECKRKTAEELEELIENSNSKWKFYDDIFFMSGLPQKHRGIIKKLIESDQTLSLRTTYRNFLRAFYSRSEENPHDSRETVRSFKPV